MIYKINDYDWVLADSEEQVREYYKNLTNMDDDEIEEIKEVSINTTMLYPIDKLPEEEKWMTHSMKLFAGELCVYKTFDWVIKHENLTSPSILASREG